MQNALLSLSLIRKETSTMKAKQTKADDLKQIPNVSEESLTNLKDVEISGLAAALKRSGNSFATTKDSTPDHIEEANDVSEQASLFERATTNIDSVSKVSDYVRIGQRWDIKHNQMVGDVIVIQRGELIHTKYGPAVLARVDHKGEQKDALLGGMVLIQVFEKLEPHLPVVTVIRKPARSYIFDDPSPEEIEAYRAEYC